MKYIFILIFSLNIISSQDDMPLDSLPKFSLNKKSSFWSQNTVPYYLFGLSLFTFKDHGYLNRKSIQKTRNRYIPKFNSDFDDFAQYAPIAMVYALNLSGIKGKNSMSDASRNLGLSFIVNSIVVRSLKVVTQVERPDGRAKSAFPSGHTATAFAAATFLHKEYGQTVSPYFSFGAYSTATVTGIFRQLNNRHWISDVLFGAGIGIMGTELVYYLFDEEKEEKEEDPFHFLVLSNDEKNLFFRYNLSYATVIDIEEDAQHFPDHGFSFGLESAYYFTKNYGFGGHVKMASFPLKNTTIDYSEQFPQLNKEETAEAFGLSAIMLGPYFKFNLKKHSQVQLKLLYGAFIFADGNLKVAVKDEFIDIIGKEKVVTTRYEPEATTGWELGFSYKLKVSKVHSFDFNVEYTHAKPDIKLLTLESIQGNGNLFYGNALKKEFFNVEYLSLGMSYSISF
jgi:hypothetical protein